MRGVGEIEAAYRPMRRLGGQNRPVPRQVVQEAVDAFMESTRGYYLYSVGEPDEVLQNFKEWSLVARHGNEEQVEKISEHMASQLRYALQYGHTKGDKKTLALEHARKFLNLTYKYPQLKERQDVAEMVAGAYLDEGYGDQYGYGMRGKFAQKIHTVNSVLGEELTVPVLTSSTYSTKKKHIVEKGGSKTMCGRDIKQTWPKTVGKTVDNVICKKCQQAEGAQERQAVDRGTGVEFRLRSKLKNEILSRRAFEEDEVRKRVDELSTGEVLSLWAGHLKSGGPVAWKITDALGVSKMDIHERIRINTTYYYQGNDAIYDIAYYQRHGIEDEGLQAKVIAALPVAFEGELPSEQYEAGYEEKYKQASERFMTELEQSLP